MALTYQSYLVREIRNPLLHTERPVWLRSGKMTIPVTAVTHPPGSA